MLSAKQTQNIKTLHARIEKEHRRPVGTRPNLTCVARAEKVIATIAANAPDRDELDGCVEIHKLMEAMLGLTSSIWTAKLLLETFQKYNMAGCQMVIIHYLVMHRDRIMYFNEQKTRILEQVCLPDALSVLKIVG